MLAYYFEKSYFQNKKDKEVAMMAQTVNVNFRLDKDVKKDMRFTLYLR